MISLIKVGPEDCTELHQMQKLAFQELLDRYQDFETNPAAESVARIYERMRQDNTDYYFIVLDSERIGAIRIACLPKGVARIAPMFLLPKFQGKGYAQKAIQLAELIYPDVAIWELDTIKQEQKLCYLYEKMGYQLTGEEKEIKAGITIVFYRKTIGN